jgi:hypothetical protein
MNKPAPTPFTHAKIRRPAYAPFLAAASEHVAEHARYSTAIVPPAKPYRVRYPLASSVCFASEDTHELTKLVAKEMHRRAQP